VTGGTGHRVAGRWEIVVGLIAKLVLGAVQVAVPAAEGVWNRKR
jgi:hypothetical protein